MRILDIEVNEDVYTVSRLNSEVRFLLENRFTSIWIEGEISNFSAPNSGHWYFSLKDTNAQVSCAMFRSSRAKLSFIPRDGMHILVKARVSLYENNGRFQLIVDSMEERGEGKLKHAFEMLKKKLEAAGLFDPKHKKKLPTFPKQIGVITSATGAAIRDILTILKRRHPCVGIIIYPTLVQGPSAAATIVNAIQTANRRQECDVLILARGGGSLEDLWPFNEESVAQAIFQSQIAIISAIGHEIDFTIADFVADMRAPTPSAAAEIAIPAVADLLQILIKNKQQILRHLFQKISHTKQHMTWVQKHLSQQHPKRRLTEKMQQVDFCELTLTQLQTRLLSKLHSQIKDVALKLHRKIPIHQINLVQNQMNLSQQSLNSLMNMHLTLQRTALGNAAAKLQTLSPLATLTRGYAIATDKHQQILRNVNALQAGDEIWVRLMEGEVECTVKKIISG